MKRIFYVLLGFSLAACGDNSNDVKEETTKSAQSTGEYKIVFGDKTYTGKNTCKVYPSGGVNFNSIGDSKVSVHGIEMKRDNEFIVLVRDKEAGKSYEGNAQQYKVSKDGGSGELTIMLLKIGTKYPATFEFSCE